jgi:outer membrane autotransporter protein
MPNHAQLVRKFLFISLLISGQTFSQSIGGCDSYSPIGGQTVTCAPTITPVATSGVLAPDSQTTIGNNVTINVQNGTALRINGSLIGIGSNAIVNNYGTLDSVRNFRYGYGMSSGANGRSQAGGSTLNNFSTGQIITSGRDADGILIMSSAASSLGNIILNNGSIQTVGIDAIGAHIRSGSSSTSIQNTMTNNGTITTSGASAFGIRLQSNRAMGTVTNSGTITTSGLGADGISISNTSNVITINNSGTISTSNARGISILGAASIVNSGTINASSEAIYFDNTSANTAGNSVTLLAGSVIQGGIRFNTNNTQEKLTFDGYANTNFNNLITGVNIIEATGNSLVVLNNTAALSLGRGTINVTNGSRLEIASTLADLTTSSSPIQTSISKIGDGILVLSGNNTFTGGTALNGGTLTIGSNQALGTGALTSQDATTLQANTTLTISNAINLNGSTNVDTNGQALTLTGLIAGTGSLNKVGDNTLTLNGANSYAGGTSIAAGTLALGNNQALGTGALTMQNATTLQANTGLAISNSITLNGATNINMNGQAVALSGAISGSGSLNKVGDNTLTLNGANSYAGGTSIAAGTLALGNNQALGTGALTMQNATTLQANTTLTVNNAINLNGSTNVNTNGQALTLTGLIAGNGPLNKIGDNTLTLNGTNSYTGGTNISAGTLALGNNQALSTGALTMQDATTLQANTTLTVNNAINLNGSTNVNTNGQALTLTGLIAGTGSLNKIGDNTLTLNAANTYTGNTTVSAGALILNGSIASNTTVMTGARLQGGGSVNGNVTNSGVIQPSFNGNPTNLTIKGNYASNGGVFASALYAQATHLIADTLTIHGSGKIASGSTQIGLINTQLLGNPTSGDGILLIKATGGAVTGNNTFYYPNRIAAGAYEYQLVKGGTNSPENWYLRADNSASLEVAAAYGSQPVVDFVPPEQPTQQAAQAIPPVIVPNIEPVPITVTPEPSQRIEVANYPSIASLARLYMLSTVDSFDQRRSDLAQSNGSLGLSHSKTSWGRVLGKSGELRSDDRNQGPGLNARTYAIQLGTDVYRHQAADGSQTWIGPFMTLGQASGNTYSSNGSFRTGNVLLQGYALGLNATHITAKGLYVDALLQATRLSGVRANSILGSSANTTGWGMTASIETGWKLGVTDHVNVTPQAQLIYNNTQMNDAADFYANIGIPNDSSLLGRLGVKVSYDNMKSSGPATQAWFRLSGLSMLSGRNSQIVFQSPSGNSNVAFSAQTPANWVSVDAGLNVLLSKSSQLSFTLGYDTSMTNAYRGGYGQIGLQVAF